jgi:hypothetical protein
MAFTPYAPVLTAVLGLGSAAIESGARRDELRRQTREVGKNLALISERTYEQHRDIDEQLGMMLTEREITALKAEASLKAGAAESGVSGRSVKETIGQTFIDKAFDEAVLVSKAQRTNVEIARNALAQGKQQTDFLKESTAQVQPTTEFLGAVSSAVGGFKAGLSFLNDNDRMLLLTGKTYADYSAE